METDKRDKISAIYVKKT